jgi:hypothetical protein
MSVTPNNIVVYGSANMPEADGVTVGGAVDFTKRVAFYDITPAGTVDWVSSSSSDTAVKAQITGRDSTGAVQTPAAVTLNGQTVVTGSQSFERIGAAVITGGAIAGLSNPSGTAAVGDVAAMAHSCVLPSGSVTTDTTYHTAQTGSANTSGTTPPLFKLASGDGASVAPGMLIWTRGRHRRQSIAHDRRDLGLWHRCRHGQSRLGYGPGQHDDLQDRPGHPVRYQPECGYGGNALFLDRSRRRTDRLGAVFL